MLPARHFAPVPEGRPWQERAARRKKKENWTRHTRVKRKEQKSNGRHRYINFHEALNKPYYLMCDIRACVRAYMRVYACVCVWKKGAPCCLATPHCANKLGEIPDVTYPQYQYVSISSSSRSSCFGFLPELSPLDSS